MLNSFLFSYGKRVLSIFTWTVFSLSLVITSIVAIAQNSVPGDKTYAIKTNFEKVILASYKALHKDTDYQIDLTKIRFTESQKVLTSKQAGLSLSNLNLQILNTQSTINSIQDPVKKASYVQKYVSTLNSINTQLEYEKQTLVAPPPLDNSVLAPPIQPSAVETQINNTQETIQTTIDNLITQDTAQVPLLVPTETPPPMQRSLMRMSVATPTPTVPQTLFDAAPTASVPTEPPAPTAIPTAEPIPTSVPPTDAPAQPSPTP